LGDVVRRFGVETASTFEWCEIATSAFGLLAMTTSKIDLDRVAGAFGVWDG
jgi:hypothetical protein